MKRREALQKAGFMAGTALAAPSLLSLLQSCSQTERVSWTPIFLDREQARFVSALVDSILPKTETPGGLDMKVDIFMDLVFAELYDDSGKTMVAESINKLNESAKSDFGKLFADMDRENKMSFLENAEKEGARYNGSVWGTAVGEQKPVSFYRSLKSLMLWGYFSSEEIGKNVLNYDPIPGEYSGCIPLSDVGNSWSL